MNPGSLIGQYRIIREIGAGGMGVVSLGEHTLLGRRAAIKTLLPRHSENHEVVERFFTEARATSAISDPGVIQIFDFGYHTDGTAYIVMELLEGESLAARIDRLGRLSVLDALRITRQAASALGAAHSRDIVHRDLKPENLFLVRDGEALGGERTKILDFGICKLGSSEMLTQAGTTVGTPAYMSPEQCEGVDDVDGRADIYALGCVLYHMLTGRPPFVGDNVEEFLRGHLSIKPQRPSALVDGLPPVIDALLARCLTKSRDDRFQSMSQLHAAVGKILEELDEQFETTTPARASGTPVPGAKAYTVVMMRDEPPRERRTPSKPRLVTASAPTPPTYYDLSALKKRSALGTFIRILFIAAGLAGIAAVVPILATDDDTPAAAPAPAPTAQTVPAPEPPAASALGSGDPGPQVVEQTVTPPVVDPPAPPDKSRPHDTARRVQSRTHDREPIVVPRQTRAEPTVTDLDPPRAPTQTSTPTEAPQPAQTEAPRSTTEDLYDTR